MTNRLNTLYLQSQIGRSGSSAGYPDPEYSGGDACHAGSMKYKTYILQSEKDSSFYIGQTEDLEKRLALHNQGLSKYNSKKTPWKIVYFEELGTRNEAQKRELFLKKQRNRSFYKKLIENWSGSSAG